MGDLEIGSVFSLKDIGVDVVGTVVQIIHQGNQLGRVAVETPTNYMWLTKEEVEKCLLNK